MIIKKQNVENIDSDIYIHDDILLTLKFDNIKKAINITLKRNVSFALYEIKFESVISFFATSCDFWGASNRILNFEYVKSEESTIFPRLKKEWYETPGMTLNFPYDEFIETKIVFASGDYLTIVCKEIIVYE